MELKGKVKIISFEGFKVSIDQAGNMNGILRGGIFNRNRIYYFCHKGYLEKEEAYKIAGVPEDTALVHISRFIYEKGRLVKIINNGTYEELDNSDFVDNYVDFIYKNDTTYSRSTYHKPLDDSFHLSSNFNYAISKNLHVISQVVDPGPVFSSTKISFDDSGRKIKSVLEQSGYLNATSTYSYPDDSAINPEYIEIFNEDSGKKSKTQYLYNKQNDVVAEVELDESKMTSTTSYFEYDYDQNGNWLEKRSLDENGELKSLIRRSITYWE